MLELGLPKTYRWNFVIADIQQPILGADFLAYYGLLLDLKHQRLLDGLTLCSVHCSLHTTTQTSISSIRKTEVNDQRLLELLKRHSGITKPPQYHDEVTHDVICFIETTGSPTYDKPRRLRPEIEKEIKDEYRKQLQLGLVRVSKSQWASGLIIKREKNKLRLIGDYRRLNSQTIPDRYPIPVVYDAVALLKNKKIFSKIDLVRAFHNIPVYDPHIEKTAVISPAGLYEHVRMPFGLRNAPSTFQRFMNAILSDLPFCTVYIDDILIFSDNLNEHYEHLNVIFQRLNKNGLSINVDKCKFSVSDLDFLGYRITPEGFTPTENRITFIKEMKPPATISALRSILGLLNFYRQFTREAATVLAPLQELLKGHPKKNDRTKIEWTPALLQDFEKVRQNFINFALLHYQKVGAKLILTCDASRIAVGAVLEQVGDDGNREPLGFFSRKLSEREGKWPAYDLELLAIYDGIQHFETLVAGRELIIVTDHRPLTYLFTKKGKCKLERRSRHAEYIAQFSTNIVHLSGAANIVADALSRPEDENNAEISQIDAKITPFEIAKHQLTNEEILQFRRYGYRDQKLKEVRLDDVTTLLCSSFQGVDRPVIPSSLRFKIFQQVHNVGHYGLKATLRLIRSKYYWPQMTSHLRDWHKACPQCQRVKVHRHTQPPIGEFEKCKKFEHIHVDLVGPLKPSNGYTYLCTFIDRTSRWVEAVPLRGVTAESVARAFYGEWIARYGTPLRVTTDRGPQFRSDLFLELSKLLGAQHIQTTAYHPQGNGLVERFHRRLKEMLMCYSQNWYCYLPSIMMGLRAAPRDRTGVSCAEMVFGQGLRIPGEMYQESKTEPDTTKFVQHLRKILSDLRPAPFEKRRKEKIFMHRDLANCKRVYIRVDRVRTSLEPPYQGPYTVLKRRKHYYELDIDGKKDTVSVTRLKPAYELDDESEEVPAESTERSTQKSILKRKGNDPSLVREGQTSSNTILNSKTVFINDDCVPTPTLPRSSQQVVQIVPPDPMSTSTQNPIPSTSQAGQNEKIVRKSSRVRKAPLKFDNFVTK